MLHINARITAPEQTIKDANQRIERGYIKGTFFGLELYVSHKYRNMSSQLPSVLAFGDVGSVETSGVTRVMTTGIVTVLRFQNKQNSNVGSFVEQRQRKETLGTILYLHGLLYVTI